MFYFISISVNQIKGEDADGVDDDEDDDDYEDYADEDMKQLLNTLPADAKRKILSKKKISAGSDDEDEDEPDEETTGWGKKKSAYYSGDTADLEIGQVNTILSATSKDLTYLLFFAN